MKMFLASVVMAGLPIDTASVLITTDRQASVTWCTPRLNLRESTTGMRDNERASVLKPLAYQSLPAERLPPAAVPRRSPPHDWARSPGRAH